MKSSIFSGVLAGCFVVAASVTAPIAAPAQQTSVPQSMAQVQLTFAPLVKRVAPAVVNVYTRTVVQQPTNPFFNDPFFQRFFGVNPQMRQRVQQAWPTSGSIRRFLLKLHTSRFTTRGSGKIMISDYTFPGPEKWRAGLKICRGWQASAAVL